MTATTIKVDSELRNRLRALARRHERTMADELEALINEAEQKELWASYAEARASLSQEAKEALRAHERLALQHATEKHRHAATR